MKETGTKHLDPLIANDLLSIFIIYISLLWVGRGDAHTKKHIWRLEANLGSPFSPSTMQIPGSTFTCWTLSRTLMTYAIISS